MWSTIENFKESLSQITADVLDAAEELEPVGLELHTIGSDAPAHRARRQLYSPEREQLVKNGKENSSLIPNGSPPKMKDLQIHNRKLQAREKDLLRQISDSKITYASLQDGYEKVLAEVHTLKQMLENERKDLSDARSQLQKNQKLSDEAKSNGRQLKTENQKMSMEITELHHRLAEKTAELNNARDHIRGEVMKEIEPALLSKDTKVVQLQELVKELEKKNLELQREVTMLRQRHTEEVRNNQYDDSPMKINSLSEQEINALKEAKSKFQLEKMEYDKRMEALRAERDKAVRNLDRLKQHLIDKEKIETEKMEQDSKRMKELEEKADVNMMRAIRLEQSLAQVLAKQEDGNKRSSQQVEEVRQENITLKKKLSSLMTALESKDSELLNLQSALGQYYAESEAKERLHIELIAAKNEIVKLSDQLKVAGNSLEAKEKEKQDILEKLTLQQKKVDENEEKSHKLEADILMLRSALEQSLTRLNMMSSDSNYSVDRRIVIKLLVTYFQRQHSKEVLELMARMLGFSEEEKRAIGCAQAGGKGMVRGVLGLPVRVVGSLLRTDSSSATPLSQLDNQSFADLWVDFLLKESEERERREAVPTETGKQPISSNVQGSQRSSSSFQHSNAVSGSSEMSRANLSSKVDLPGSEFTVVPLTSSSIGKVVHPRT